MFGWLFGVVLIIIVVWYFSKGNQRFLRGKNRQDTAREVLDKRYARGEITREEYKEQKKILRK